MNIFKNLFCFSILFISITLFAFPLYIDFLLSLIFIWFLKEKKIIIIITSIMLVLLALTISKIWGNKDDEKIYFRPHEKFKLSNQYIKNLNVNFTILHGDLYSIGKNGQNSRLDKTKQSRNITFITDNFGNRNTNTNNNKPDYFFLGDSFVNGNGLTQDEIPSVIFEKLSGLKVTNIAFPGLPSDYEKRFLNNKYEYDDNTKIIVYYFEGNDFFEKKIQKIPKQHRFRGVISNIENITFKSMLKFIVEAYYKAEFFKDSYLNKIYGQEETLFKIIRHNSYKFNDLIKILINKNIFGKDQKINKKILINKINNIDVAFYRKYIDISKKDNLVTHIFTDSALLERIAAVVFIPTKYTVYSEFLDKKDKGFAFRFLSKGYSKYGIQVLDLTPALRKESLKRLKNNQFTFFKDDTHWNSYGVKASMEFLKENIK
jgi:hypothetical protein